MHLAEADNHRPVADKHDENQQCHKGGVGQREGQHQVRVVIPCCIHINKAPRALVILSEPSVAAVRQEAEGQGEEINKDKSDFGKAAADVHGVKVRVADGQTALHGNGAQDECGCQAEEDHREAKEVAQAITTQSY